MVHYVDAYVPYGPLIGADPPLRFFTLHAEPTKESWRMPQDRDHLAYRGRRKLHAVPAGQTSTSSLPEGESIFETIFDRHDDGLESFMVSAGPNAMIELPPTVQSSGQFVFVAGGIVGSRQCVYEAETLGWQPPNDEAELLCAGPSGSRIVVMRFPSPATPVARALCERLIGICTKATIVD